jgi:DNA-binding CsgD family transcriptional regulator
MPRLLEALGRPAFPGELARFLRDETGAAAASIREIREDAGEDRVVAATSPDAVAPPTALPVPGLYGRGEAWVDDVPLPAAGDCAVMRSASALVERNGPRAIVATLMRAADARDAVAEDRMRLVRRLPVLRALWRSHQRGLGVECERNAVFEALGQRGYGTLLLDRFGVAISLNRRAAELMRDGGALRLGAGRVRAADTTQAAGLEEAMLGAVAALERGRRPPPRALVLRGADGDGRLRLHLCAIGLPAAGEGPRVPALALLLDDPARDIAPEIRDNARQHGLTAVETELACRLADGRTVDEAASDQRISVHTARKYLQQIFAKTSTSRQAELVRVLISGAAPRGAGATRRAERMGA